MEPSRVEPRASRLADSLVLALPSAIYWWLGVLSDWYPSWTSASGLWLLTTTLWFCAPVTALVSLYFLPRDFAEPGKRWQCAAAMLLTASVVAGVFTAR